MFYFGPPPPRVKIKIGADYRKRGETLPWRLVSLVENEAGLSGPGSCRGMLYLHVDELEREYERV